MASTYAAEGVAGPSQAEFSAFADNYNLDRQWLNTVDQPLLNEAVGWSEQAAAETTAAAAAATTFNWNDIAGLDSSLAQEANTEASLALQIAGEAPASRQNATVTINNSYEGCETQITVYANGSTPKVHDIDNTSAWSYIEEIASTVVNVVAMFVPALAPLAVAVDSAEAGQDFANGQDLQGILSIAQAVGAGLSGLGANIEQNALALAAQGESIGDADAEAVLQGMETADSLTTGGQVATAASQVVGGAYGAVASAQSGNDFGILAGVLEVAAGAAAGIGATSSDTTFQQSMATLAQDIGTAGIAASMAGAFESGNVAQGLIDSLNIYPPAVAQAYANDQNSLADVGNGVADEYAAVENATAQYYANQASATVANDAIVEGASTTISNSSTSSGQAGASQVSFSINTMAFAADIAATAASDVPDFSNAISSLSAAAMPTGGYTQTDAFNNETWQFTFAQDPSNASDLDVTVAGTGGTSNTISANLSGIAETVWGFLSNNLDPIGSAQAAETHPLIMVNPFQYVGASFVGPWGAQCVAFIQGVFQNVPTNMWIEGPAVTPDTPLGTVVATFDATGQYINSYVSSHVGVFEGFDLTNPLI